MYLPEASILPTVSFPPGMLLTCQVTMLFVPPETPAKNCCGVATVTEAATGEMAMVIPVTGSMHEEEEAFDDVLAAVVVQVMAVLGAVYLWHETRLNAPMSNARTGRLLTAPLSLVPHMPIRCGSVAISLPMRTRFLVHRFGRRIPLELFV